MDYTQLFNEALDVRPETIELASEIESTYKKIFPKGWVKALPRNMFKDDFITLSFGLIGEKKEWAQGIRENDPMHMGFIIRPGKKGWASEQTQGKLMLNPPEGSYLVMKGLPLKFRKYQGDSAKTIKAFEKFFKKIKTAVKDNESNIYNRAEYSDKWFK
jgi:hypothetical protein